jgi:hypothetical protein
MQVRTSTWIVLAFGIGLAGVVFYSLLRMEPIQVMRSGLVRDGSRIYVAGEVEDTADAAVSAVKIELHYFDQHGRPAGQDTLIVGDLKPYESKQFRGPARNSAGVRDYSIYVNHERNPYGN